jgi:anaerobic magnesium-protoporphyrin IX monomethyl ester cyclase
MPSVDPISAVAHRDMKILLVNPNTRTAYNPLPFPPLGLMSVAAVVQDSYEVMIHDRNLYADGDGRKMAAVLSQFKPDLVGVTSLTGPAILDGILVSRLAKEAGALVVWGGTHASLLPHQTLENRYIDFVVINEGEETFKELVTAIELHCGYSTILGLGYKEDGEIRINAERPFIRDLDTLPMPAWNLVPVERYIYRFPKARRKIAIVTSRGCLFRCSFCYVIDFHKRKYRGKSAGCILAEIAFLQRNYGIDGVRFDDDLFVIDRPRLREFCSWVARKDVPITWDSNCRAEQVTPEFLDTVRRGKCHRLTFGLESGSNRILRFLQKDLKVDQIVRAFELLNATDIMTGAAFLVGLPTETRDEVEETIALARRINAYHTHFYPYVPFPGSPLAEYCRENALIDYPTSLEKWANLGYARLDEMALSEREIKKLSARFEVRNVIHSLRRGELALLSNFIGLSQMQNVGLWSRFFAKAMS